MSELLFFLALFFVAGEADACVVADEAACNGVDGNLMVAKIPLLEGEANVDGVFVLVVDTNPFTWNDDTASVMAMAARAFTLIRRVNDDDEHIVCCLFVHVYSPPSDWK